MNTYYLLLANFFIIFTPNFISADDGWAVCTLEGLLSLSKGAVNEIQPAFNTIQSVRLFKQKSV